MTISTAEKIETIILSRCSGTFGQFVEYEPGRFRVTADNRTVLARVDELGWHVSFKSFEAIDPELYVAARDALAAGENVGVTRHADLGAMLAAWS